MSPAHQHDHTTAAMTHRKRLVAVLAIQASIMVGEVIGAVFSGSAALLADAGHMLTDSAGVALALGATWLAARPATAGHTFGWQRAEILAALANALLLMVVSTVVIFQGVQRMFNPMEIHVDLMLIVATIGAAANLVGLLILRAGQKESLNIRGAYLEVMGDLLGSAAVIVAGVVVALTGWLRADAVASIVIGVLILPRAWSLLRDVVRVLLEGTPPDVDLGQVRRHIVSQPGVVDVHDLHVWTITSGVPVLSAHVLAEPDALAERGNREILEGLHECLHGCFDVKHCTFQIEPVGEAITEGVLHA